MLQPALRTDELDMGLPVAQGAAPATALPKCLSWQVGNRVWEQLGQDDILEKIQKGRQGVWGNHSSGTTNTQAPLGLLSLFSQLWDVLKDPLPG